jgi:hypothetical protein
MSQIDPLRALTSLRHCARHERRKHQDGRMDHIQRIALLAQDDAHDGRGKVLLYAEVEDGAISADLFSQTEDGPVRFRFSSAALKEAICEYWEAERPDARWAAMALTIENGAFVIDLRYEDQLIADESVVERRPRIVIENFGDAPVDYSSPKVR